MFTKSKSPKRTCPADVQGADLQIFARARAHVFQPFIDLLTRRHPTVLFLHSLSLSLCVFYFFIVYIVSISKESATFLHNRSGEERSRKASKDHEFRNNNAEQKQARLMNSHRFASSRQHETFISLGYH